MVGRLSCAWAVVGRFDSVAWPMVGPMLLSKANGNGWLNQICTVRGWPDQLHMANG